MVDEWEISGAFCGVENWIIKLIYSIQFIIPLAIVEQMICHTIEFWLKIFAFETSKIKLINQKNFKGFA